MSCPVLDRQRASVQVHVAVKDHVKVNANANADVNAASEKPDQRSGGSDHAKRLAATFRSSGRGERS
jgi:hypothetical protein